MRRGLRFLGVRLVSPASGLLLSKDPDTLAIYEVCESAEEQGIDALSPEQRMVVHAWSSKGIIDNGGFRYYLEGSWRIRDVAEALRTLGFADAADACDEVSRIFSASLPPQDWDRRNAILGEVAQERMDRLSERVWAVGWGDLKAAIIAYMARRPAQFPR